MKERFLFVCLLFGVASTMAFIDLIFHLLCLNSVSHDAAHNFSLIVYYILILILSLVVRVPGCIAGLQIMAMELLNVRA